METLPPENFWITLPYNSVIARLAERMKWNAVCESPIEVDLAIAIDHQIGPLLEEYDIKFKPQYSWQRFRADFAFLCDEQPKLFVECDGKDFHSTDEQLARDREKDRAAERLGISVLRFAGSEIFRAPDGCIQRILEYLVRGGAL